MEFDELFGLVREYTMEEAGIWEFFSAFQDQFRQILYLHFHVFVNSRTKSGKYYTYISMYPLIPGPVQANTIQYLHFHVSVNSLDLRLKQCYK